MIGDETSKFYGDASLTPSSTFEVEKFLDSPSDSSDMYAVAILIEYTDHPRGDGGAAPAIEFDTGGYLAEATYVALRDFGPKRVQDELGRVSKVLRILSATTGQGKFQEMPPTVGYTRTGTFLVGRYSATGELLEYTYMELEMTITQTGGNGGTLHEGSFDTDTTMAEGLAPNIGTVFALNGNWGGTEDVPQI